MVIITFGVIIIDIFPQSQIEEIKNTEDSSLELFLDDPIDLSIRSSTYLNNTLTNTVDGFSESFQILETNFLDQSIRWDEWFNLLLEKIKSDQIEVKSNTDSSDQSITQRVQSFRTELKKLEKIFNHPLYLDQLSDHLGLFFWLSQQQKKKLLTLYALVMKEKVQVIELKRMLELPDFYLLLPFVKFKVRSHIKDQVARQEKTDRMENRLVIKTSKVRSVNDFYQLLQFYHLRNYGFYQKDHLTVFYLWDRDPNEYEVFDLVKGAGSLRFLENWELYLGAINVNFNQRLLFSTGYKSSKNILNPLAIKKIKVETSKLRIDQSSSEIYLNGVGLEMRTDRWGFVSLVGEYVYDKELQTNGVVNHNQIKIPYVETYSLSPSSHELPLGYSGNGELLKERIYFLNLEYIFSSLNHSGKLATSFFYGEFNAPILGDGFYGKRYFGQSFSWSWQSFPFTFLSSKNTVKDNTIDTFSTVKVVGKTFFEFYGELAWLANEKRQMENTYSDLSREYYYSFSFHGGVWFYLYSGNLLLSYREVPRNYHAIHNLSYSESSKNDERGLYLGYSFSKIPRFKWNLIAEAHQKISDPQDYTVEWRNYIRYRFSNRYFIEQESRIKDQITFLNYYSFLNMGIRFQWQKKWIEFSGKVKMVGESETDYLPSLLTGLKFKFEFAGKIIYRWSSEMSWAKYNGTEIYGVFYHNRFYQDRIYVDRNSLLALVRQELKFDHLSLGFSIGTQVESTQREKAFYENSIGIIFFSGYFVLTY